MAALPALRTNVRGRPAIGLVVLGSTLVSENNRLALLAEMLLPLHAQLGGHVMDENRHVTLQADEGVARGARQHLKAILGAPAVPQRLIGIARQQRLFEGVNTKLASALNAPK
jgi:hypothetical protein